MRTEDVDALLKDIRDLEEQAGYQRQAIGAIKAGVSWMDAKAAETLWKGYTKPRKVMALAGISADGLKFFTFLKTGNMMNSVLYCKMLNKHVKEIVKKNNLMILQNWSKVHTSKTTNAYLKKEKLKSLLLPWFEPDRIFFGLLKQKLEKEPTRSLKEVLQHF